MKPNDKDVVTSGSLFQRPFHLPDPMTSRLLYLHTRACKKQQLRHFLLVRRVILIEVWLLKGTLCRLNDNERYQAHYASTLRWFLCIQSPKGSLTSCGGASFCFCVKCLGLEEKDSQTKLFGSIKRGNISSWMRDPLKQRVLNWWCHNKTISRGVDRCWCAGPLSRDYYLFTLLNHSLPDATRTPLRSVCWGRGVCVFMVWI